MNSNSVPSKDKYLSIIIKIYINFNSLKYNHWWLLFKLS